MGLAEIAVICGASCVVSAILAASRAYESRAVRRCEDATRGYEQAHNGARLQASEHEHRLCALESRAAATDEAVRTIAATVQETNTRVGNLAFKVR